MNTPIQEALDAQMEEMEQFARVEDDDGWECSDSD